MSFPLTAEQIVSACGNAPSVANVQANWTLIEQAIVSRNVYSDLVAVAAIATIHVECPPFKPIHEYGDAEYFHRLYDIEGDNPERAQELGNLSPGDGAKYAGRGFIQLTGLLNYRFFAMMLNHQELVESPDLALQPQLAADIFALYFMHHGCIPAANARNWVDVRRRVNGGTNGMPLYLETVNKLLALLP
jgi:hypothetical protein